jgi:hypothetical protein
MHRTAIALCALAVAGCTTDSAPGFATVGGHVVDSIGAPLQSVMVTVSCEGHALEVAPGDTLGHYFTNLESTVGAHQCSFLAVNPATPAFRVDTAIAFAPAGLHPIQTVDMQAP